MQQPDPSLGALTVRFVEAEYDDDFVTGASMDTYCMVWLLEKTRWKRRKSRTWGRAQGDPMHPEWGQEFEFYDVRDDAKAVIDVWNKQVGGEADQFLGKALRRLHTVRPTACTVRTAQATLIGCC